MELSLRVIRSMIPGVHSKNNNGTNLALYYAQVRDGVQSSRTRIITNRPPAILYQNCQ